jgi:exo-beta-1,3-glucanase (GH17 family)
MYRGNLNGAQVASSINDVRGMLRGMNVNVPVGHVDANIWTTQDAVTVIQTAEFVGIDLYPFWQGSAIDNAGSDFWSG